MGCTSSTPKMASQADPSDKNLTKAEETGEDSIKKVEKSLDEFGTNGIKVLPTCDTLGDHIQLDSVNKSPMKDVATPESKDVHANGHVQESDNENANANEVIQLEEKFRTLEEVVDKVVELYVADNVTTSTEPEYVSKVFTETHETVDGEPEVFANTVNESENMDMVNEENNIIGNEEHPAEEAISPSQSESSRATRWEALADIAAELPPSLAVDPLTGQIYALSK